MNNRAGTKIVIVGGGGTFGSSTALHLVRSGYTPSNITILDVYPIPSPQSAGNDLNKIMGIEYEDEVDLKLSLECREMWNEDELFKPFFHGTGKVNCAGSEAGIAELRETYRKFQEAGTGLEHMMEWLDDEDAILAKVPLLERDKIEGWKGVWSADGGWLAAGQAINAIGEHVKARGVNMHFGPSGSFKAPLFAEDGSTCIGVETINGEKYHADKVVLAAGAWSPTLIDLKDQCVSKEEAAMYKGCPVVYNGDIGFFFEPNEHGVIKVCDEFPGFTRFIQHWPYGSSSPQRISVPRSHAKHPSDTIPLVSEQTIGTAIKTYLPRFKDKPRYNKALCWCTDTADSNLLVCEHPGWKGFYIASGDSGHSFKILPNIGKHIVELLEGRLPEDLAHAWRWRPGQGDAWKSTRAARAKDLADVPGWKHDDPVDEVADGVRAVEGRDDVASYHEHGNEL